MSNALRRWSCPLVVSLVLSLAVTAGARSGSLAWHADQVDAQLDGWPLPDVLRAIAGATGWQLYVEPHTDAQITTSFQHLAPAEALHRLLGDLSFALLPQSSGPSKLFVYRGSVDDATERVQVARTTAVGDAIAGERIVTLVPGAGIDALAKRLGARVLQRLDGLNAYRLAFDSEASARRAAALLAKDRQVASIETNVVVAPLEPLQPVAEAAVPSAFLHPDISPSANRVIVGLVDTAVQNQDPALKDFLLAGVSVQGDYQAPSDGVTHGTAMALTILDGVAFALREAGKLDTKVALSIQPIDVYGGAETTTSFDIAQGIYEALNRHVNVVNLSLAGNTDSPLIRQLVAEATRRGVLFFAAAGNESVTARTYPAADPGVIAVTAADATGRLADYANRGTWVEAIAPGGNVVQYLDRTWGGNGTSFSTTRVSGWAAGTLLSQRRSPSVVQQKTLARWGIQRR